MADEASSIRDFSAPADNTKTLPFECTYPKCIMRFATLKEMKLHKKEDPNHYYCKRCDVDCENHDALIQHKVESMAPWVDGPMKGNKEVLPKHICCEFCGLDMKSMGGRELHRKQFHPAQQSITCKFEECCFFFAKASDYVRHFEDNRCQGISAAQYKACLEHIHVNKQIMKDPTISKRLCASEAASMMGSGSLTEDTDTEHGGVALSAMMDNAGDESLNGLYRPLEPEQDLISLHEPRSPTLSSSSTMWSAPPARLTKSMRSMSINTSRTTSVYKGESSPDDYAAHLSPAMLTSTKTPSASTHLGSFPSLRSTSATPSIASEISSDATASVRNGKASTAWGTNSTVRSLFPNARPTPAAPELVRTPATMDNDLRQTRWWDPDHAEFQPEYFRFKDLMEANQFACPFIDCDDSCGCDSLDTLKAHLRIAHLAMDFRCPSCKKAFARPSALVAHTDSSSRCQVAGTAHYQALIEEVTAGFMRAKRLAVPKIYRPEKALVLANGKPVDGIMQTEFKATIPKQTEKGRF